MEDVKLTGWLNDLAAKQPTPGGGGAAALATAIAAGLVSMVCRYTTGDKWAEVSERMEDIATKADDLRQQALAALQADAEAFAAVGAAYSLPKDTDDDKNAREAAIQSSLLAAAQPPCEIAEISAAIVKFAEEISSLANPNLISDVAVAASQAKAALESAIVNIEVNASLIQDSAQKTILAKAVIEAEAAIIKAASVVMAVRERMNS